MRIFIAVSHSFCAHFIRGQARYLKAQGWDVFVVSAPGPEITELAQQEDVKLLEVQFSREISLHQDLRSLYQVMRLINRYKPDVINAGTPKAGFLFMISHIFFRNIPMIFTLRGLRSDTLKGIKKIIVRFTEKISCSLADKVIVISPSLKDHAVHSGILSEKKAVVIGAGSSNGVNISRFTSSGEIRSQANDLRSELGIAKDRIIIGHVGRITRDKGVVELYEAFKICIQKGAPIDLVLTGPLEEDDPLPEDSLSQMKSDNHVHFLGQVNDIPHIYEMYDILVLYSFREGFGNVVMEAACMQVPAIVADIPGLRDTVENKITGLTVPPADYRKLAKALEGYIYDPVLRSTHGKQARKRVEESFASEVIWHGQNELYKGLTR